MVACTSGRQCSSHTNEQIRPRAKLTQKTRFSINANKPLQRRSQGEAARPTALLLFQLYFSLSKHPNRRHSNHYQHCLLGLRQNSIRSIPSCRGRYTEESCGMKERGKKERKKGSELAQTIDGLLNTS